MENIKQFIITNWPIILEYTLMFLAYFLVFLYRAKVKNTKTNLTLSMKGQKEHLEKVADDLSIQMKTELAESKAKYQAAIDKIETLEADILALHKALKELLFEEVSENESTT